MATALHPMELRQLADAVIVIASLRMAFNFSAGFKITIDGGMQTSSRPIFRSAETVRSMSR